MGLALLAFKLQKRGHEPTSRTTSKTCMSLSWMEGAESALHGFPQQSGRKEKLHFLRCKIALFRPLEGDIYIFDTFSSLFINDPGWFIIDRFPLNPWLWTGWDLRTTVPLYCLTLFGLLNFKNMKFFYRLSIIGTLVVIMLAIIMIVKAAKFSKFTIRTRLTDRL